MPNHIINEIVFRGLIEEERAVVLTSVRNNAGHVDFNILVPEPLNVWRGSVGTRHEKAFDRTGLDWARENWGTKWNAYGQGDNENYKSIVETDDGVTLTFQTAWTPPYPWLAALFNFTKFSFEHNWLDEGCRDAVAGRFNYPELEKTFGDPWSETKADPALTRHLHKLMYGVEEFPREEEET